MGLKCLWYILMFIIIMQPTQKHRIIASTVTVAIIAGLISWAMFLYTSYAMENRAIAEAHKNQGLYAAQAAGSIERFLYDVQKRMETIALMPIVRDAQRSESCNQNLQNI